MIYYINESAIKSTGIVKKINSIEDLSHGKGCTEKQIKEAQSKLDMVFPKEYLEYLRTFGHISFGGYEWTGLDIKGYLNTVVATEKEKDLDSNFPPKHFVLEDPHIDAITIIVDEAGKVYKHRYGKVTLLFNSISEYLDHCLKE